MFKIFTIAWKDSLLRFSSASELIFFLVLPVAFTIFLGGGLAANSATDNRVALGIVDHDRSELSAALVAGLEDSDVLRSTVSTSPDAENEFGDRVAFHLIIPAGLEARLYAGQPVELLLRQPAGDNNLVVQEAIERVMASVVAPVAAAQHSTRVAAQLQPFAGPAEQDSYFQQGLHLARSLAEDAPVRMVVTQPERATVDATAGYNQAAHASAGQLVTWVFIPMLAASAIFAQERQRGTFQRLLATPTGGGTFLLGTAVGQIGLAILQMSLLIGFGAIVIGVNWGRSPAGLALLVVTFSLASVGLGLMLGSFIKTEGQASGLSIMFGMLMAMLGGCWYPIEIFPEVAQRAVQVLPTTWAMRGFTDLVIRGGGLAEVLPEVAGLLLFAALFFIIGAWRFRYEP